MFFCSFFTLESFREAHQDHPDSVWKGKFPSVLYFESETSHLKNDRRMKSSRSPEKDEWAGDVWSCPTLGKLLLDLSVDRWAAEGSTVSLKELYLFSTTYALFFPSPRKDSKCFAFGDFSLRAEEWNAKYGGRRKSGIFMLELRALIMT